MITRELHAAVSPYHAPKKGLNLSSRDRCSLQALLARRQNFWTRSSLLSLIRHLSKRLLHITGRNRIHNSSKPNQPGIQGCKESRYTSNTSVRSKVDSWLANGSNGLFRRLMSSDFHIPSSSGPPFYPS